MQDRREHTVPETRFLHAHDKRQTGTTITTARKRKRKRGKKRKRQEEESREVAEGRRGRVARALSVCVCVTAGSGSLKRKQHSFSLQGKQRQTSKREEGEKRKREKESESEIKLTSPSPLLVNARPSYRFLCSQRRLLPPPLRSPLSALSCHLTFRAWPHDSLSFSHLAPHAQLSAIASRCHDSFLSGNAQKRPAPRRFLCFLFFTHSVARHALLYA